MSRKSLTSVRCDFSSADDAGVVRAAKKQVLGQFTHERNQPILLLDIGGSQIADGYVVDADAYPGFAEVRIDKATVRKVGDADPIHVSVF